MHATPDAIASGEALLKPLQDFYEAADHPMPAVRFIPGDELPQPYRNLLVHDKDMTSTLQRFHDEGIRVHVLDTRKSGSLYEREVLLVTRDTNKTVEFGAIEIALDPFPAGAQREILRAETPLGAILQSFRIEYKSAPRAFFEIVSDAPMNAALKLPETRILYGRCNELTSNEGRILAEIVEILPPVER
jgi:chorismate-pyruvate lyase